MTMVMDICWMSRLTVRGGGDSHRFRTNCVVHRGAGMRLSLKFPLLIAPIVVAAAGCASKPSWVSQTTTTSHVASSNKQSPPNRTQRLLEVASKYEREGNAEVAKRLYEHVLSQEPKNSHAQQRLVALGGQIPTHSHIAARISQKDAAPALASGPLRPADPATASQPAKTTSQPVKGSSLAGTLANEQPAERVATSIAQTEATAQAASTQPETLADAIAQAASEDPLAGMLAAASIQHEASDLTNAHAEESPTVVAATEPKIQTPEEPWWDFETAIAEPEQVALSQSHAMQVLKELDQRQPSDKSVESVEKTQRTETAHHETAAAAPSTWKTTTVSRLCPEDAPEEIIQLVSQLESSDVNQRIEGLVGLGLQGSAAQPAASAVQVLLSDEEPIVRVHAAAAVCDIQGGSEHAIRQLTSSLYDPNQDVVRLSAYLLGRLGADAQPATNALRQLRDQRELNLTSLHAAEALTRITPSDTQSYTVLTQGLESFDVEMNLFSAVSLGEATGDGRSIAARALAKALNHDNMNVRATVALSLGGLGDDASIAIEQLQRLSDDENSEVREAALTALACLGY